MPMIESFCIEDDESSAETRLNPATSDFDDVPVESDEPLDGGGPLWPP